MISTTLGDVSNAGCVNECSHDPGWQSVVRTASELQVGLIDDLYDIVIHGSFFCCGDVSQPARSRSGVENHAPFSPREGNLFI